MLGTHIQFSQKAILCMIKSSEQGGASMEKSAHVTFHQTPDMGLELHDKLGHTIITTGT